MPWDIIQIKSNNFALPVNGQNCLKEFEAFFLYSIKKNQA
jgi:hypothetical protein